MRHGVTSMPGFGRARRGIGLSLFLACLAAAVADLLFYRHALGISAVVFCVFLAGFVPIANPIRVSVRTHLAVTAILLASLLPLVEHFSPLSLASGVVGLSIYTLVVTGVLSGNVIERAAAVVWQLLGGPVQLWAVIAKLHWLGRRKGASAFARGRLKEWAVPIFLGTIFLLLFRSANPLIEQWLAKLDVWRSIVELDFARIAFWAIAVGMVWSFVRVRLRPRSSWTSDPVWVAPGAIAGEAAEHVLGANAVLRSLVVFNLLFAVQSGFDIAYLWAGARLPAGMTYASYAHRGAYPLIVTALLAAAFVLIALRPGSDAERSPLLRGLVYLWTGQNVLLVISSVLRLNVYVEVYSLTYWRIAAFIWMCLVAAGLILILARIALGRSSLWLISRTLAVAAATLYVCAYVNFAHVVAAYNVSHSGRSSRALQSLDTSYLCDLGPDAMRAMGMGIADATGLNILERSALEHCLRDSASRHRLHMQDWRGWSFRGWRLMQYLDVRERTKPEAPAPSGWRY